MKAGSENLIQKEILQTFWRIRAFLCNDIRLIEANRPVGSLPALLSLEKEACDLSKEIKGEKGQEKKGRKQGGISVALDLIVYKGEPAVHQITLILRSVWTMFSRCGLDRTKTPLPQQDSQNATMTNESPAHDVLSNNGKPVGVE